MAASVIATSGEASIKKIMDASKLIIPVLIIATEISFAKMAYIAPASIITDIKVVVINLNSSIL